MNDVNATEDRLRSEIESLKRQLEEQKHDMLRDTIRVDGPPPSALVLIGSAAGGPDRRGLFRRLSAAAAARSGAGGGDQGDRRHAARGQREPV